MWKGGEVASEDEEHLYVYAICYSSIFIGKDYIEVFTVCFTSMSTIVTREKYMYLQASTKCYFVIPLLSLVRIT
jgi:hypothetical protein